MDAPAPPSALPPPPGRRWRGVPLWLRLATQALALALVVWVVTDTVQSAYFRDLFTADVARTLELDAEQNRLRFDATVRRHAALAQLITGLAPFSARLESGAWDPEEPAPPPLVYAVPPPWMPPPSLLRVFESPSHVLVLDLMGQVREVYNRAHRHTLPTDLSRPAARLVALASHQAALVMLDGLPHVVAAADAHDSTGRLRARVLVASRLDGAFLAASQGQFLADGEVVALIGPSTVHAASDARAIAAETPLAALDATHLRLGRDFMDYGSSEIPFGLATFIPRAQVATKVEAVMATERAQRTILAAVLTLGLTALLFALSLRLRAVALRMRRLAGKVLPGHAATAHLPRDELRDLEDSFRHLLRAILRFRRDQEREAGRLRSAMEQAAAAGAAKNRFLANMSHELRTPLNAILGFTQLMQAELFGPLGARQYQTYVDDIHGSGVHLLGLINDLLDMAKIDAGKLDLVEEPCDIADLVESCLRLLRGRAAQQGVGFTLSVAGPLPPVLADRRRVRQVLLNLLSNAVKFSDGGRQVRICVGVDAGHGLAVLVRDDGIGMSAPDLSRALEPFTQVDEDLARRFEGSGLGLPLALTLARLHGGTVELDTAPGEGTSAWFCLPPARLLLATPVEA